MSNLRKHQSAGFSLLEIVVVLVMLSISTMAIMRALGTGVRMAGTIQSTSTMAFFDEMLFDRVNILLQNTLFWIANVSEGCEGIGRYIHGNTDGKEAQRGNTLRTTTAAMAISQFSNTLTFHTVGTTPRHKLRLLENLTVEGDAGPGKREVVRWYNANSNSGAGPTDSRFQPVWQQIRRCITTQRIPNALLTPTQAASGLYEFCIMVDSDQVPMRLKELANGMASARITQGFQFGFVRARLRDALQDTDIQCNSRPMPGPTPTPGPTPPPLIGGAALNRSFYTEIQLFGVDNSRGAPAEQKVFTSTRTFFVQKEPRPLVNCSNCQNRTDPAWQFQCSTNALCACFCPEALANGSLFPSAVTSVYPECGNAAINTTANIAVLCAPGALH